MSLPSYLRFLEFNCHFCAGEHVSQVMMGLVLPREFFPEERRKSISINFCSVQRIQDNPQENERETNSNNQLRGVRRRYTGYLGECCIEVSIVQLKLDCVKLRAAGCRSTKVSWTVISANYWIHCQRQHPARSTQSWTRIQKMKKMK